MTLLALLELKSANGADYFVIGAYLLIVALIGVYLARANKKTADYFKAGGKLPWWMAGLSTFMTGFSAYMFVVAAGFTYKNGLAGLTIYTFALWAYLLGFFVFGTRWRRSRLSSPMEFLKRRYSSSTAYYYTLITIVPGVISGGLTLYILCIFIATALGITKAEVDIGFTTLSGIQASMIVVGVITILYTTAGGLWAVVITDVVQFIILFVMTLAIIPLSFKYLGGDAGITGGIQKVIYESPPGYFDLLASGKTPLFFIAFLVAVLINYNSKWAVGQRYYSVPDERDTKKMAILCAVLAFVGPLLWIIPTMVSRNVFPDLGAYWPSIKEPAETSFVSLAMLIMPHGMIGLVVASILAATMSCVDSEYNAYSAIITKDIYLPLKRKLGHSEPSERQQLWVGRITIIVIGSVGTIVALAVAGYPKGAFEFGLKFTSLFLIPVLFPIFAGLVFTRTPWWSAIASSAAGIIVVVTMNLIRVIGGGDMHNYGVNVLTGLTVAATVFFVSAFFKNKKKEDDERLEAYRKDLKTPAHSTDTGKIHKSILFSYQAVGAAAMLIGALLVAIGLFQGISSGQIPNYACGGAMLLTGIVLFSIIRKKINRENNADSV